MILLTEDEAFEMSAEAARKGQSMKDRSEFNLVQNENDTVCI
jgi:hypothetical protein